MSLNLEVAFCILFVLMLIVLTLQVIVYENVKRWLDAIDEMLGDYLAKEREK